MKSLCFIFFWFSLCSYADRISSSEFTEGKIIKLGACSKNRTSIAIKTKYGMMESRITGHTILTKDSKKLKCKDLEVGQKVKLGYAQGNDIMNQPDFWIFDSIEVLSNPSQK